MKHVRCFVCLLPLLLLAVPSVLDDGGFFFEEAETASLAQSRQEVLLAFYNDLADGGPLVTYVLRTTYTGEPADFAWVVPVPATPTDVVAHEGFLFDALNDLTKPKFVLYQQPRSSVLGCACAGGDLLEAYQGGLVEVEARGEAGIFEWAALTSTGSNALLNWLNKNHFAVSLEAGAVLARYVEQGMHFLAVRVSEPGELAGNEDGEVEIPPIQFTCQTAQRFYPLAILQASAAEQTEILVYVCSEHRAEVATVPNATIDPQLVVYDASSPSATNYESLFAQIISDRGGVVLITEYAMTGYFSYLTGYASRMDQAPWPEAPAAVRDLSWLARMRTVITRERMMLDFEFQDASDDEEVSPRFELYDRRDENGAAVASRPLAALALFSLFYPTIARSAKRRHWRKVAGAVQWGLAHLTTNAKRQLPTRSCGLILGLLTVALPAGCPCEIFESYLSPSGAVARDPALRVPFVVEHGMPIVQVFLNDRGPFRFLLDTAATRTIVFDTVANAFPDALIDSTETSTDAHGATGESRQALLIDRLCLGCGSFNAVHALVYDSDSTMISTDAADGILGFNLFADVVLTIDYAQGVVLLEPDAVIEPRTEDVLDLLVEDGHPYILGEVGEQSVWLIVDTGCDGFVDVPGDLPLELFSAGPAPWRVATSLFSRSRCSVARLAVPLRIGPNVLPDAVVEISDLSPKVGFQFLRHFTVTFDQRSQRIRLSLNTAIEVPTGRHVGFETGFDATQGVFAIGDVIPGSPADEAGVTIGEIIVSIEGSAFPWSIDSSLLFDAGTVKISPDVVFKESVAITLFNADGTPRTLTVPIYDPLR